MAEFQIDYEKAVQNILTRICERYGVPAERLIELAEADREGRITVLPCKVGDILYKVGYNTCSHGEDHPYGSGCCGCNDACNIQLQVRAFKVPNNLWILKNYNDILSGVWYTERVEAEDALERRRKK